MLRILRIEEPIETISYCNASARGGTEIAHLPIHLAPCEGLPPTLDALIATSDLQGRVPDPETREALLLGVAVARTLETLSFDGVLPHNARTGVLLAGDFFCVPEANQRGGFGSVAPVWNAFSEVFSWVAGVAGNHDDARAVTTTERVALLDGTTVTFDQLRIAGVSLIAGNKQKPGRRSLDEQLDKLQQHTDADLLLLHEGPPGSAKQPGNEALLSAIEHTATPLVVFGHSPWKSPLATLGTTQLLNVHERVVVLCRA